MKFYQENFVDEFAGGTADQFEMRKYCGKVFWRKPRRKSRPYNEEADCSLGTIGLFAPKNS